MPLWDTVKTRIRSAYQRLRELLLQRWQLPLWLLAIIVILGVGGVVTAYITYAPEANTLCKACHNMVPFVESIEDTGHGNLNCHVCHPLGPEVVKELYIQIVESPSAAEIKERSSKKINMYEPCLKCHTEGDLGEKNIHEVHNTMAIELLGSCDICHDPHDLGSLPEKCTNCHKLGRAIEVHSEMHEYAVAQLERGKEGVCFECHSDYAKWKVPLAPSCLEGQTQGKTCFDCHEAPLDPPMIRDQPCTECHST